MKRIIIAVVALAALSTTVFGGNVDAGRIEIGGSAGISTSTDKNGGSSFSLFPFAMFYVAPGLALGGSAGFSTYGANHYSGTTIGIGPRVAYYFDIGNPTLYPFVAGGVSFTHSSTHIDGLSPTNDNTFSIPLEGGVRFFLNNFVALDAGLNLNFSDGVTNMALAAGFSMFLR